MLGQVPPSVEERRFSVWPGVGCIDIVVTIDAWFYQSTLLPAHVTGLQLFRTWESFHQRRSRWRDQPSFGTLSLVEGVVKGHTWGVEAPLDSESCGEYQHRRRHASN